MASTTILSDNGASSGSAGLKQTAGNDGVLILQTTTSGGTATNAIYVDTSQNVGLGITPSATGSGYTALQVRSANVMSDGSATVLYNNAYYTGSVEKYIATGYANKLVFNSLANGSVVLYGTSSGSAAANITFTNILQVNKDATLALQGGSSSSGTGIAFPATQSASSDANTLDDYEEGTFTPTMTGDSTPTGITYSAQVGRYVKVGKMVQVEITITLSSKGSGGSGAVYISGLPFASAVVSGHYPNFGIALSPLSAAVNGQVTGQVNTNDTKVTIVNNTNTTSTLNVVGLASITNTTDFRMTFAYQTA